jgi:hypothetical protein
MEIYFIESLGCAPAGRAQAEVTTRQTGPTLMLTAWNVALPPHSI